MNTSVAEDNTLLDEPENLHQYVTFKVADETFAVQMAPVQEIIRVPEVVRVPLAPPSLIGLANLRGKVLPILSLRRLFGIEDKDHDDASRAIVVDVRQDVGFTVDRVASVIDVEPELIEPADQVSSSLDSEMLSGVIKNTGGHELVMILDLAALLQADYSQMQQMVTDNSLGLEGISDEEQDQEEDDEDDKRQLVSFEVAGQEYAIDIDQVQEIVQLPDSITRVPRADQHILGIINLRERLLPLVNLSSLFHLPQKTLDDKSRIVVLNVGNASLGVVVDAVNEVLRVDLNLIEPMLPILAKEADLQDIAALCRLEQGKRLVSIIATEQLIGNEQIQESLQQQETEMLDEDVETEEWGDDDDDEQLVVFRLGDEEFAVSINTVQEIVRIPDTLIRVPKAPAFVEGIINLRGVVLPVVDLRTRLELTPIERSERQRIVVFNIEGVKTGFIVDLVTEVLKLSRDQIEATPKMTDAQHGLLSRMANLKVEGRMIQLLDADFLMVSDEMDQLKDLAAG